MKGDGRFGERMILLLETLINHRRTGERTIKAICKGTRLDRRMLGELAMYALAKRWVRIEPVGNARIHSITQLGRQAYKDMKAGSAVESL